MQSWLVAAQKDPFKLWRRAKLLRKLTCAVLWMLISVVGLRKTHADEMPAEYQFSINRGLEYVAQQQAPDGHWGERYPAAMTGISGISLLMEGSTLREGKYSSQLRRAVDWLLSHSQSNGLLGDPREETSYMYGHGYSLLFLSCVYGEENDRILRAKLEEVLTRAVLFSGAAQDKFGGWHYISARDGGDGDSSATVVQMHSLRAARNAGIVVPKEIIDKGMSYLRYTSRGDGGVGYARGSTSGSVALTAAALASSFSAGEYNSPLVKQWLRFCEKHIWQDESIGAYTHGYFAQVMYNLGEDRYARLFPDSQPEARRTWSMYRKHAFTRLLRMQEGNGSWRHEGAGDPVYRTATYLIIMQLDKATLPIYQR